MNIKHHQILIKKSAKVHQNYI